MYIWVHFTTQYLKKNSTILFFLCKQQRVWETYDVSPNRLQISDQKESVD